VKNNGEAKSGDANIRKKRTVTETAREVATGTSTGTAREVDTETEKARGIEKDLGFTSAASYPSRPFIALLQMLDSVFHALVNQDPPQCAVEISLVHSAD
jgi:hypothetical protein